MTPAEKAVIDAAVKYASRAWDCDQHEELYDTVKALLAERAKAYTPTVGDRIVMDIATKHLVSLLESGTREIHRLEDLLAAANARIAELETERNEAETWDENKRLGVSCVKAGEVEK